MLNMHAVKVVTVGESNNAAPAPGVWRQRSSHRRLVEVGGRAPMQRRFYSFCLN